MLRLHEVEAGYGSAQVLFAIRAAKCAMKSDEVLCISLGAGRIYSCRNYREIL